MKIYLDSPINKYYVQTLGMIFFPGEHFGEEEQASENTPFLSVRTTEEEGGIRAFAEIGCNAVLCPGCIVGEHTVVYPLSRVRGTLPANVIFKGEGVPVAIREGD